MRRRGRIYSEGMRYSESISHRYTHRGACWESNALLWLRNMRQRLSKRCSNTFSM